MYSNVECQGWESDLSFCDKTSYNDVICSRSNMAGLVCRDGEYNKSYRQSVVLLLHSVL